MRAATRAAVGALATTALTAALAATVTPAYAEQTPRIQVADARTQPVFSYTEAVREHVLVETSLDSDGDGEHDLVGVDIIRPKETEEGLRVPVIMEESPYYDNAGRGNEAELKKYDENGVPTKFPLFYDNYFVPRGYAVVLVDMIGTNNSDGCPDIGARADVLGGKAVIDWLNGRGTAHYADGSAARPYWTNGRVGMIGKSYDGTLANAVAATGVEGLVTIVPIAAISSWYDYYRMNGVVYFRGGPTFLTRFVDTDPLAKCAAVRERIGERADDATGNFNAFWAKRDYIDGSLVAVDNIRASVFAVHGLNDLNVKPNHFSNWWRELARRDVPRKLWVSLYGHVEAFDFRREVWIDTLHRWFDYWLHGIENQIMAEPRVDVQVGPDRWVTRETWPARRARPVSLRLRPDGPGAAGSLGIRPAPARSTQSFTDDPTQEEEEMVEAPTTARPDRLVYVTPPLRQQVRISGVPRISIRASLDQRSANLTALVVDYGEDVRIDHRAEDHGIRTLDEEGCYGKSSETDDACYKLTVTDTHTAPVEIVARGWLDTNNRRSLRETTPVRPGQYYRFQWTTLPHDYTFEPGHRIALVLAGSDESFTTPDKPGQPTVTVSLTRSKVVLPVVGDRSLRPRDFRTHKAWRGPSDVDLPNPPEVFVPR